MTDLLIENIKKHFNKFMGTRTEIHYEFIGCIFHVLGSNKHYC